MERQPRRHKSWPVRCSMRRNADGLEPRMGAAGTRLEVIKIRADVGPRQVQHLIPNSVMSDSSAVPQHHADEGRHPRLCSARQGKSEMPTFVGITGWPCPWVGHFAGWYQI